jgi:hypothetical protein
MQKENFFGPLCTQVIRYMRTILYHKIEGSKCAAYFWTENAVITALRTQHWPVLGRYTISDFQSHAF